jgi:hypothetical protein
MRRGHSPAGTSAIQDVPNKVAIFVLAMSPDNRKRSVSGRLKILGLACTVAGESLIAGLSQVVPARGDENRIAAGYNIAVRGLSPERPSCAACHLQNGAGQPDVGIPRLPGLTSSYIAEQLNYFATGLGAIRIRDDAAPTP